MTIDADLKTMAQAKNFAALTTLMPDGQPQTQLMWVHADDDHLIINTETGRQKFANITVDPRVTVTVFDATNPYRYVEARGRGAETVTGDEKPSGIDELAQSSPAPTTPTPSAPSGSSCASRSTRCTRTACNPALETAAATAPLHAGLSTARPSPPTTAPPTAR
nr:TIGR03618 family F420-dependent PPOX class oxidoreductase [Candidatus Microthrix sp.]